MKYLMIVLFALFMVVPVQAEPNDWNKDYNIDCEVMPGHEACANYVPITQEGFCLSRLRGGYLRAIYNEDYYLADYLYQRFVTKQDHVLAGGELTDADSGCMIVPLEIEEEEEEEEIEEEE